MPRRLLDLTRTVARAGRIAPGGIDRTERAWAAHLAQDPEARFLVSAGPRHAILDGAGASELIAALEGGAELPPADLRGAFSAWNTERQRRADSLSRRLSRAQGEDLAALVRAEAEGCTYLNVAQAHLDAVRLKALRAGGIRRAVAMAHDLVALQRPELARAGEQTRLMGFLAAVALCDGVLYASREIAEIGHAQMEPAPPARVAPPGLTPLPAPAGPETPERSFVMLGAIEPRRNHLAMLWIWQRLWHELGEASPLLFIVGRRAAESEMVEDFLERSPMSGRVIFERRDMPDPELAAMLSAARALLMPSFAEGAGLAVAEALSVGCPVIAADIPALRSAGGLAPDYIDPLDLPTWLEAVLAYAHPHDGTEGPRERQIARLAAWRPRPWRDHFEEAEAFFEEIGA